MNLSFSHSWLKDFLTTNANPEQIANCLSLCGPSVESLTKVSHDYIYEIEVTTNRVDCLSVMGIARELAVILPQFGFSARLKNDLYQPSRSNLENLPHQFFPLKVSVDSKLCPRFTAVVIKNVTVKSSPKNIRCRLELSGIRSLNNVIDISNYLMRAYGQPVHVFDLDKIKSKMILRSSKPKETITTLDGKTHILSGNDIVIEDDSGRLIDLCGIMGGLNSSVDHQTKNVLLFVQTYNPVNIRQTSMKLTQRTEAAVIFEKSPDSELVMPVILQGIEIFKKLTGGEPGSKIIDIYPHPPKPKLIFPPLQLIKERLGVDIPTEKVKTILSGLGFVNNKVPSWRNNDIAIPEDLVEEVARIYGYHNLPSRLMAGPIPTNYPNEKFDLEYQIKTLLVGLGLTEIYTNSLISESLAKQSGFKLFKHLKIKNALSQDWLYLRRSLIPSHLQALANNPQAKKLTFFEIAHTYHPQPGQLPQEKLELIISTKNSYFHLKGIVDALFTKLHLPVSASLTPATAVIDLKPVLKTARLYPQYQPLSSHPSIIEDLTFTLPEKTHIGPIINTIKSAHRLIKSVKLSKTYQQNYTFTITYQSMSKDLSSVDVAPIRQKIVSLLKAKFQAQLVGEI